MHILRNIRWVVVFSVTLTLCSLFALPRLRPAESRPSLSKEFFSQSLKTPLHNHRFPDELVLAMDKGTYPIKVQYTIDWDLQNAMEDVFDQYKPDYGAFVAIDVPSGKILSLVSFSKEVSDIGNLALRASFPAASLLKIVTAAAAVETKTITPETIIPYNGSNYTLYKRNVLSTNPNHYSRNITVADAFAKSVNTVFAKLGVFYVERGSLRAYAEKFYFNHRIPSDVPIEISRFSLPDNDVWQIAEAASGFTKDITISPVQGALLAATIANDGKSIAPYVIEKAEGHLPHLKYVATSGESTEVISDDSAKMIRTMMQRTIQIGTCQKAFRKFLSKTNISSLELGGKTGSLAGDSPKGKYDWFIGYARKHGVGPALTRRVAIAALTINELKWRIKASQVASTFIEKWSQ